MKKPNLKDQRIAQLETERDCLLFALADLANGKVQWVCRSRKLQLGLCRPESASGGIVIHRADGYTLGAYYFERWLKDIRDTATYTQSEDALFLRDAAEELNSLRYEALKAI